MSGRNLFFIFASVLCAGLLLACASTGPQPRLNYLGTIDADTSITAVADTAPHAQAGTSGETFTLKVATLNLAHGRKDSLNQFFLSEETIRANLDDIARVFRQQQADIVALQEPDAASFWSGDFDHVAYLAKQAHYPWHLHAYNVNRWFSTFGTALLSRIPLLEGIEYTFEPSPPTLDKGFVLASIHWPGKAGEPSRIVDIISVHLDFSRQSVRDQQLREMREVMASRMNPTIVLGDFNSEWLQQGSVINELAKKSRFSTFQPKSNAYNSYKNKRLDWILITRDLEFVSYRVLPDNLSDHRMTIAEIKFKSKPSGIHHARQ